MKLGDLIREYRAEHKYSLREFADICDISFAQVRLMERGLNSQGKPFVPSVKSLKLVAKGDLKPIVGWLTERIYRYGRLLKPNELILKACEAPFDPHYYVEYLKNKYTEVYGIVLK